MNRDRSPGVVRRWGAAFAAASVVASSAIIGGVGIAPAAAAPVLPAPQTISTVGAFSGVTVPAGACSVEIVALGAGGGTPSWNGTSAGQATGGAGARIATEFAVTEGDTISGFVGGGGVGGGSISAGGRHPGGANTGGAGGHGNLHNGGGGGGLTSVSLGGTEVIVAGAGGGAGGGHLLNGGSGGNAGLPTAADTVTPGSNGEHGQDNVGGGLISVGGGQGGQAGAPGAGGAHPNDPAAFSGVAGSGRNGGAGGIDSAAGQTQADTAGGGGGGYFGGGGGGGTVINGGGSATTDGIGASGGGGGSSWVSDTALTLASQAGARSTQGGQSGANGAVTITWGGCLDLRKTSNPAAGTPVQGGQQVEYTVELENLNPVRAFDSVIADDLSGVFDNAEYQDDIATSGHANNATITGDDLAWAGVLDPGQTVTITYSVIVNDNAAGELLENRVTASGTPPGGTPYDPPPVTTEHPVGGFEITKTSNPASGSTVQPGDTIEYTVTGENTGAIPLNPASIADDLSDVLSFADYNDDVAATIGNASVAGDDLTWNGTLDPGQTVTITYSVTVQEGISGEVINNVATGSATPVGPNPNDPNGPGIPGDPIVPNEVRTEHPAIASGFEFSKTSVPAAGAVDPGNTITYTLTGENTGDTVLSPATITDDLSLVLANASYNGDVSATSGTPTITGNDLSWSGTLAPGATVEITYSVRVNDNAGGATLVNDAEASATPQIPVDPRVPNGPTTPGTPITGEDDVIHTVNTPGFTLEKVVDPAAGTAVDPGEVLQYTVTATNTGQTVLDPVVVTDDLSSINEYGTITTAPVATVNGNPTAAPVVDGDELTWTGELGVGESVTITYSVTVGPNAIGEVVENTVEAEATVPGNDPDDPRDPPRLVPPPVTVENPVNMPGFSVSKAADPAPGTAVDPGEVVTYTVTGTNTGETALNPVEITDNLSGVLEHAAYNGDVTVTSGTVSVTGEQLDWNGSLAVGESVTITYSVTVNADAGGSTLENRVTGTATPPGGVPPIETPPATVMHPVKKPGFEIDKVSNPASTTAVDPGSVITYTVSGVNTGETVLDPVEILDDMSGVLAHAKYNRDVKASTGDVRVKGDELSWKGSLAVGERVTITYSVTVKGDAGGETLENLVSGRATPPGVDPDDPNGQLVPPPVSVEHPVNEPGFDFSKTSNPGSGRSVAAGEIITYTLKAENTGETVLDPVKVVDDLSGVLGSAKLQGAPVAKIGKSTVKAPKVTSDELTWSGKLNVGETVTITYSVKVNDDATGGKLKNSAVASATTGSGEIIKPAPGLTEHQVKTRIAVTGERAMPWIAGFAALLLAAGATVLVIRRRTTEV